MLSSFFFYRSFNNPKEYPQYSDEAVRANGAFCNTREPLEIHSANARVRSIFGLKCEEPIVIVYYSVFWPLQCFCVTVGHSSSEVLCHRNPCPILQFRHEQGTVLMSSLSPLSVIATRDLPSPAYSSQGIPPRGRQSLKTISCSTARGTAGAIRFSRNCA
jgi:hypothetical protein